MSKGAFFAGAVLAWIATVDAGAQNLPAAASSNVPPPAMARVPGGVYQPLFRAATGPKAVRVKSFYLDVLPVTVADFLAFVRANPGWRRSQVKRILADESYLKNWAGDLEPGTNVPPHSPVTGISWFAANACAQWKGKRLPTVAEWELAASASPARPDGANDPEFKRQVLRWYGAPAPVQLPAVGLGRANFWGLHDLHGLVWEWVYDFSTATGSGDARGDIGPYRDRFCGAGAVGARDVDDFPPFMRDGFRSSLKADYCVHNLGFRCARDL